MRDSIQRDLTHHAESHKPISYDSFQQSTGQCQASGEAMVFNRLRTRLTGRAVRGNRYENDDGSRANSNGSIIARLALDR
jgi:hypothetical protein